MKIALIRKKYSSHGGAERYLQLLIDGLLTNGHEVHLFAHEWQDQNGVKFHPVKMIKGLSALQALSFAYYVREALKHEHFDLVHSLERTLEQDIYRAGDGCHKEWLLQRKKIYPWWENFFSSLNPLHPAILWLEKQIYNYPNTKFIIANSERGKQEIIGHYNYPGDKIKVIYNGVDIQRFHPKIRADYRRPVRKQLGIDDHKHVLLWVGSGFKRKGLINLLNSLDLLWASGNRSWFLLVLGKDKITRYQKKIKDKPWAKRIIFLGPQKDVERYYAAADIFVLPTIYEPFANTCLEALACGLPVITSAINGASEILTKDTGSIIENPTNIKQLAEKISYWQESERLRKALLTSKTLAEKFTIQKNVQETIAVYQMLAAQPKD